MSISFVIYKTCASLTLDNPVASSLIEKNNQESERREGLVIDNLVPESFPIKLHGLIDE
jgi:hypothetical protein